MESPGKDAVVDNKGLSPEPTKSLSHPDAVGAELPEAVVSRITRISSTLSVLVSGLALFSDGYNAQIIGYMEPLFSDL